MYARHGNFVTYSGDKNTCKYCLSEENKGKYRVARIPYIQTSHCRFNGSWNESKIKAKKNWKEYKQLNIKANNKSRIREDDAIAASASTSDTKHSPDKMNLFNDLDKVLMTLCSTTPTKKPSINTVKSHCMYFFSMIQITHNSLIY